MNKDDISITTNESMIKINPIMSTNKDGFKTQLAMVTPLYSNVVNGSVALNIFINKGIRNAVPKEDMTIEEILLSIRPAIIGKAKITTKKMNW